MRNFFGLGVLSLLLALLSPVSMSFTLQPSMKVLTLPADIGGVTLVLKNPRNTDLPVVFEMVERKILNEDGDEVRTPSESEFVIFPPQAVVPAGKSQAVRVQWVGGALSQSRSFTLFANEQPVNLNKNKQLGVTTLLHVGASIHVTNQVFEAKPELVDYQPSQDGVVVSIANSGNEFINLDKMAMRFGREEVSGFDLANTAQRPLIYPGAIRTFKVKGVQGVPELILKK